MEYGDMSSLIVEYPDYNSLGETLQVIGSLKGNSYTVNEAPKMQQTLQLPKGVGSFESLAGRAIIATLNNGDLVGYGVVVDESLITQRGEVPVVKGVAMCENLKSTVPYRAYFDLLQLSSGNVTFRGMLRTETNMNNDDKMIINVNAGKTFDIDFESAYGASEKKSDIFQEWHPCYVINEETVESQDPILGRSLSMYGINSLLEYSFAEDAKLDPNSTQWR
jgi:hypothetical protein